MSNTPIQDEPYLIAMSAFHAGSMGQAGKTIHSGTVKEWTDRIEAYKDNACAEARIDELKKLNFIEASGFLSGGNHIVRQGVVTRHISSLEAELNTKAKEA